MDLTSISTHNTNTTQTLDAANTTTKTTPPTPIPTTTPKSLSFANGTLKRHPTTTVAQPPSMVVSYKECLKNHAASIGGHALDGCGEFMLSSSTVPSDPRSLKCAACGCHRNFHRREPQENNLNNNLKNNNPTFLNCIYTLSAPAPLSHRAMSQSTSPSLSSSPSHSQSPISSPSPPPLSHVPPYHASAPHMLLALGSAYSAEPSDEHHHHQQQQHKSFNLSMMRSENPTKKRYRTKFSKEQKEKMHSFSEKLGWRMQKGDDGLVQEFCNDIGVSRGVFKVWMHNNKNTFRKKSEDGNGNANAPQSNDDDNANGGGGGFDSDINNPYNPNSNNNDIHMKEVEDACVNNVVHVSLNEMSS
ncbi:zinc-finger homeodomain protein 11-like [Glycine soja]|uniref:Zinc-finger homeodomain protein 11 n=1 Tax=Glycine soja TaxID=3848 RepID=A0A445K0G8_GLYSO|nr:zinc-finger homeodomain protein 11-like [Glycine soja]RZC04257.1 Zinc-finger homeodomain protein 11 [Glycine soja]